MSSVTNVSRKKSTSTGSGKKAGVASPARRTSGQSGGAAVDHFSQTRIKEVARSMLTIHG